MRRKIALGFLFILVAWLPYVASLMAGGVVSGGTTATARVVPLNFYLSGTCTTGSKPIRLYAQAAFTIASPWVTIAANTAPTGATLVVDVNHNATTIFTTQANRPAIAISGNTDDSGTADGDVTVADGEYISVDIDQCGSTAAGADVTVQVYATFD